MSVEKRPQRTIDIARSPFEKRLVSFLESKGIDLDIQVHLGNWHFDMQIAGTNILIEADGEYWHSEAKNKGVDARKNKWCEDNGYVLFRILSIPYKRDREKAIEPLLLHYLTMLYNS